MQIQDLISHQVVSYLNDTYHLEIKTVDLQTTREEFVGDYSLNIFPYLRQTKCKPEDLATAIGENLKAGLTEIIDYNVIKGFLNLVIANDYFLTQLKACRDQTHFGYQVIDEKTPSIMLEYSSPNTNKPLHLGHVRNNLLGYAVANILRASGKNVIKTQVINDRGIHICKSMLAWKKFGNNETPSSSGLKGDKLVGKYYVAFDAAYKNEVQVLVASGKSEEEAKKEAPILREAQTMLQQWESGDPSVIDLWKMMNAWVYEGFEASYKALGVSFDFQDYESQTYLLGKKLILEALENNILYQKPDHSIWINLSDISLDDKLLMRGDGTSVYMTQDIGTAVKRFENYPIDQLVYTVGNEQDHHFKVLFAILDKLGYSWASKLRHLSYGMVNLADGSRMKSREGTIVDADDLMEEMIQTAREFAQEAGKLDHLTEAEKEATYKMVGLGALKYFILKVDPKKNIKFDPVESIDFNGNTGPFIQYTYARICSLLNKGTPTEFSSLDNYTLSLTERELIKQLLLFPLIIQQSAEALSPAIIANYTYHLVKIYNHFYQNFPILKEVDQQVLVFRLLLSKQTAYVIKNAMLLLGIAVPERM